MSQQDNCIGGFIAGAILGGLVGGAIGALATARLKSTAEDQDDSSLISSGVEFDESTEESMELARRGLETKIAQLNSAIDDVRQQLGGINGRAENLSENSNLVDS